MRFRDFYLIAYLASVLLRFWTITSRQNFSRSLSTPGMVWIGRYTAPNLAPTQSATKTTLLESVKFVLNQFPMKSLCRRWITLVSLPGTTSIVKESPVLVCVTVTIKGLPLAAQFNPPWEYFALSRRFRRLCSIIGWFNLESMTGRKGGLE